jgi:serine/threonine protein kinase
VVGVRPAEESGSIERPVPGGLSGTTIGGKYRLISQIGRGGMGEVWRAEHLGWSAPVAIKLMNPDVAALPEARARFDQEARLAAELRSPHVVQLLDHGVDDVTHMPFLVMELLEGESLDRRLRRLGQLSPPETYEIVSQLVRALSRAHEAGIVHRDLKPENIFLVRDDEHSVVKVLDFGIAKESRSLGTPRLTRPGRVLGTPFYMSPEQFRGSVEIDQRADVWSLSAIVCECLTGKRPFEASDFGELALLLLGSAQRPLPSELGPVPDGFDAWFERATHSDIERRFQSVRELGGSLAALCEEPSRSLPASSRRNPGTAAAVDSSSTHDAFVARRTGVLSGATSSWVRFAYAGGAALLVMCVVVLVTLWARPDAEEDAAPRTVAAPPAAPYAPSPTPGSATTPGTGNPHAANPHAANPNAANSNAANPNAATANSVNALRPPPSAPYQPVVSAPGAVPAGAVHPIFPAPNAPAPVLPAPTPGRFSTDPSGAADPPGVDEPARPSPRPATGRTAQNRQRSRAAVLRAAAGAPPRRPRRETSAPDESRSTVDQRIRMELEPTQ